MRGTLLRVGVVAVNTFWAATALAIEVGDTVRVSRRTELKVEQQSAGFLEQGTLVKVEKINGDWFWVKHEGKQGWIARNDVSSPTAFLDSLVEKAPQDASARQLRATMLILLGQLDEAMKDCEEGVRLAPNDASAYNTRGACWLKKGEYDKAMADFNRSLELDPAHAQALHNRGSCWQAKGDCDRALADYEEALRLKPDHGVLHSDLGDVWYTKHQYDKALAAYDEALRLNPKLSLAQFYRGCIFENRKEHDKAIAAFTAALALDATLTGAYVNRSIARGAKKEYAEAIADCDQALAIDPKCAAAYFNRGDYLGSIAEYGRALADYRKAIELDPKYWEAYHNLAWNLATCPEAKWRNGAEAVQCATKACELTAWEQASTVGVLAVACAEAGDFDAAVKRQQQAMDLTTDEKLRADFAERLKLFREKHPYHVEARPATPQ